MLHVSTSLQDGRTRMIIHVEARLNEGGMRLMCHLQKNSLTGYEVGNLVIPRNKQNDWESLHCP